MGEMEEISSRGSRLWRSTLRAQRSSFWPPVIQPCLRPVQPMHSESEETFAPFLRNAFRSALRLSTASPEIDVPSWWTEMVRF